MSALVQPAFETSECLDRKQMQQTDPKALLSLSLSDDLAEFSVTRDLPQAWS